MLSNVYDYILAGGGLAGLSLASYLVEGPLKNRTLLIIDQEPKNKNDRTWCYWSNTPTLFDSLAVQKWGKLRFVSDDFQRTYILEPYTYNLIRGIDLYNATRSKLAALPNVTFVQADVQNIRDAEDLATVTAGGQDYQGFWIFNSLFRSQDYTPQPGKYHYLKQHFRGWEIETTAPAFDPDVPVFFDFRTPQNDQMRFFYILPLSSNRALIEFTVFSPDLLADNEYDQALKQYIEKTIGIKDYQVLSVENGMIPMTDQPFIRRLGKRILATGTRGGLVKPSSGFAFMRIQRDCQSIVHSLEQSGHPFDIPLAPNRYRWFDSVMLQIMLRSGSNCKPIFTAMFKNNSVQQIYRFLDEQATLPENLKFMTSMPLGPFIRAALRVNQGQI
jgi:lycopene beta-cyclase